MTWSTVWHRQLRVAFGTALLIAACHGPSKHRSDARPTPLSVRPSAEPSARPPALPPPPLIISNRVPGQFDVRANVPLELSTQAKIEAQAPDGHWTEYSDLDGRRGYYLRETCSATALPKCRKLFAGEQLSLAAWTGSSCSAQCAAECPVDRFHPGVHRLVLHGCDSPSARYEGPPFDMAGSKRELWRWRASPGAGILRGQVFRLDPHGSNRNQQDGPPAYIAGFRVLKDSARPLAPELLVTLAEWLRFRDGFLQYDLIKDCFQEHLVGLLLELDAPRAEERAVEIALNLSCNSAFIVTGDGRGRIPTVSHFDPSWAQLISIVRRALPHDPELAELRESPSTFPATMDEQSK
ncbi:MAG TPA: hypothetical protein VJV79_11225 [Polyangiaceae bacterium]|nr:hypothetical protein [Polyangiaceae bacterium]